MKTRYQIARNLAQRNLRAATRASNYATRESANPAYESFPYLADATVPFRQPYAIKAQRSLRNACAFAEYRSIVAATSVERDAAQANGKLPSVKHNARNLDHWIRLVNIGMMMVLRRNISTLEAAAGNYDVVIPTIAARSSVIKDPAVHAEKPSSTKSVAVVGAQCYNHHYLAAQNHRLAVSLVRDPKTAGILKSPITVTRMMSLVQNALS